MNAGLPSKIDQLSGLSGSRNCSFNNRSRRSGDGDYGTIVIWIQ